MRIKLVLFVVPSICFIIGISLSEILLEVNAQSEGTLQEYQSPKLGISFQYPSEWREKLSEPSQDCERTNNCNVSFDFLNFSSPPTFDSYLISVQAIKLDMPSLETKPCNCNSLRDYVTWRYNSLWKDNTFINDNHTKMENNCSAWQIEFGSDDPDGGNRYFAVLTINDYYGYAFMYAGPSDNHFGKYLEGFRNMVKSVKFTTVEPEEKPPFMAANYTGDNGNKSLVDVKIVLGPLDSDKGFEPGTLTISKGTTVRWTNDDSTLHTVTSGTPEGGNSGLEFDSAYLASGKTFEHTFNEIGTFYYYCTLFPFMTGRTNVIETVKEPSFLPKVEKNSIEKGNANNQSGVQTDVPNDGEVSLSSSDSYVDSIGYLHIVGEIENNTSNIAKFVKVVGTFYDSNNDVVATAFTYTNPSDISPGDKAPFEIIVTSASIPLSEIDHYRTVASYQ